MSSIVKSTLPYRIQLLNDPMHQTHLVHEMLAAEICADGGKGNTQRALELLIADRCTWLKLHC